jgi:hypothetical protein
VSLRQESGTSPYVHLHTLWSYYGVRVRRGESEKGMGYIVCVREVVSCSALVDTEKMKKSHFFISFLSVVGVVLDSCGIHQLSQVLCRSSVWPGSISVEAF